MLTTPIGKISNVFLSAQELEPKNPSLSTPAPRTHRTCVIRPRVLSGLKPQSSTGQTFPQFHISSLFFPLRGKNPNRKTQSDQRRRSIGNIHPSRDLFETLSRAWRSSNATPGLSATKMYPLEPLEDSSENALKSRTREAIPF